MTLFLAPPQDLTKIIPVVEIRERYQRRVNPTFSDAVNDSRTDGEQRYRVGFDFKSGKRVSGQVRYQYTHNMIWTAKKNASDESSDMALAHVGFATQGNFLNGGTLDIGRQYLKKGSQRLLEESNFGQRSKSFDVVRFRNSRLDLFAGKVGYAPAFHDQSRIVGGSWDDKYGETLAVFKHDQWISHQDFWTFDRYNTKRFGPLLAEVEGAFQKGRNEGAEVDGWFLSGRFTYTFKNNSNVWLEADAFSGGGLSGNKFHTFIPLYGRTDPLYGYSNFVGFRNLNMIQVGTTLHPLRRTDVNFAWSKFQLRDATDGWYANNGSVLPSPKGKFIDPTGKSGRDAGQEFDTQLRYNLSSRDYLALRLSLIRPGSFVRAFNGANTKDQFWTLLTYERKM